MKLMLAIVCGIPLVVVCAYVQPGLYYEIEQQKQHTQTQRQEARHMAGKIVAIFGSVFQAICECKGYNPAKDDPRKPLNALANIVHSFADCIDTGTRSISHENQLYEELVNYLCTDEGSSLMIQYNDITKEVNP